MRIMLILITSLIMWSFSSNPVIAEGKAAKKWKRLYPARNYFCWRKSPWDSLFKEATIGKKISETREIKIAMGKNEYESTSFVLTNFSGKELEFEILVKESSIPVILREAVWVTSHMGKEINDALPLLEGKLSIPSGESREIWLTLHSKGIKAGNYKTKIEIKPQALPSHSIDLKIKVYPVTLPDDKPIYTYYWDYLVPAWTKPEVAKALVEDMKQHYVNVAMVHPWPARLKLNSDGTLKEDYKELDSLLKYYRSMNPKMIVFAWNSEAYFEGMTGFFGDEWKALFKSYMNGLVNHLKEKGWGYDKFAIIPYDERMDSKTYQMVKLIKEIDPKIKIIVNATGNTIEEVRNIAPYVDIWCPFLYDYLNFPNYQGKLEEKQLGNQLLKKSDEFFWTYANPPGSRPKEAPPYRDYRLAVWRAWKEGMRGFGYWIYCYKTHWDSYKHKDGANWAVVYFADAEDAPPGISKKELVVTSKRWEATREGVEDYVYLYMLREAIKNPAKGTSQKALNDARKVLTEWPKKVLGNVKNARLADMAKEEILKILSRIKPDVN